MTVNEDHNEPGRTWHGNTTPQGHVTNPNGAGKVEVTGFSARPGTMSVTDSFSLHM
ncbi:hypothetical protein K443DRAFT_9156 [Laccaria amethystina LaAM-08-1]|uniref:Uncharacterized protein n=1 Tax=Laccaria amethystina LaAM-08-1 TaxID=1095629 RepID=A0A0C9XRE6_9AGAR|nr:hypothetical protein K443DRAFT_9156 [Laccaria amethystina LaAM-08-1]